MSWSRYRGVPNEPDDPPDLDEPINYSPFIDLHYSDLDGGWFAFDYRNDVASVDIYDSAADLRLALDAGSVTWED